MGSIFRFGLLAILFVVGVSLRAEALEPSDGHSFYFDRQTKRFFTNGKTRFSIQPTKNSSYLERIEVSVGDEPFRVYPGFLEFKEEGLHTVRFRATDPVLNWSPTQVFRLHVDLTPPVSEPYWQGATVSNQGTLYVHPKAKLFFGVQDNLSGVKEIRYRETGSTEFKKFKNGMGFSKEGPDVVQFSSLDHVGNEEIWQNLAFTVEGKAPEVKASLVGVYSETDKGLYIGSGGSIELQAVDEGAGVQRIEYQIDAGPILAYERPIIVTKKEMQLKYRALDHLENHSAWKGIQVIQDTQPPKIELVKSGKHVKQFGKIYARPGFKVSARVLDAQSGLKSIRISKGESVFENPKNLEFSFDEPGEYRFALRAEDQVGNVEESFGFQVVIDNEAPKTVFKNESDFIQKDELHLSGLPGKIQFDSSDSGVGLDYLEYSYDGKTFKRFKDGIDLATWQNPENQVYFRAVDRLGNKENVQKIAVRILKKAPEVGLFVEDAGKGEVPLSKILQVEDSKQRKPAASGGGVK